MELRRDDQSKTVGCFKLAYGYDTYGYTLHTTYHVLHVPPKAQEIVHNA